MENFIPIFIIVVFLVLGVFLCMGKGGFLIAGYNTMSKEEKEKYNTVAICRFMGKMMFLFAVSVAMWCLSDLLHIEWLFSVGIALFLGTVIFIFIYLNVSKKFKKK
ncbi:MAG TPA: DUF3784 domain-containing protein [Clostridiales bacterium]|nr:DUF3784 domain-containing protein [Clostridiales bacterium]